MQDWHPWAIQDGPQNPIWPAKEGVLIEFRTEMSDEILNACLKIRELIKFSSFLIKMQQNENKQNQDGHQNPRWPTK